jgi:branched-chain amino acid transport system permease protein
VQDLIVTSSLNGLLHGMLLFLLAAGLTLIYRLSGTLNLTHAGCYMLGAFAGYEINRRYGFWHALWLSPLLIGGVATAVERHGMHRVRASARAYGPNADLLVTFGLGFVITEVVRIGWGRAPLTVGVPTGLDLPVTVLGTSYPAHRLAALGLALFIGCVLLPLLTCGRVGRMLQASVPATFGVGCGLAAVVGVIAGPALATDANMAGLILPILFVVVVVGGLGSLAGALVASLLVALIPIVAATIDVSIGSVLARLSWVPGLRLLSFPPTAGSMLDEIWRLTVAQLAPVVPFLLLVLVLIIRPHGLIVRRAP